MNIAEIKILIVDDDISMRSLLRSAITQWGFQAEEASDGDQAWQIMRNPNPPQLLILDWRMPKMDGITLCKLIREKLDFYPYVIFLTKISGATNITKGFDAGADEFLLKPINFTELRAKVFSGEKIVKYIKTISEQNKKINTYLSYIQNLSTLINLMQGRLDDQKK